MIATGVSTDLYAEVLQFYARQMQALDNGDFQAYADSFTDDGEFTHSPGLPPARTRAGIAAELTDFHRRRFSGLAVQRRHWFNHVVLDHRDDGGIDATSYALVLTVHPSVKQPEIGPSCVVRDVLVRVDGDLRLRSRRVDHDQDR
ncbi:nuclear transport factor 2 family protein [Micromonospora sp. NPDC004540]|uniref:nuclear transport factor 2 family protein n=1 Tax=Micromonospora TaxID=1873 RepID=UPI0033B677EF